MIRLTFPVCFVLLFVGCSKKSDPAPVQPDPAPEATLSRSFYDPTTNVLDENSHAPTSVTALATGNATAIFLTVQAMPDELNLGIERAALSPNWLGTYLLKCRPRPGNPAQVSYSYTNEFGGTSIYLLSTNLWNADLSGNLTITEYDAARQLVSGTFSVVVPNQLKPDETAALRGATTLTVTGTFRHVKVKPIQ